MPVYMWAYQCVLDDILIFSCPLMACGVAVNSKHNVFNMYCGTHVPARCCLCLDVCLISFG